MKIEFDDTKNEMNIKKHGLSLEEAFYFDFAHSIIRPDNRFDYTEERFQALGFIGERLYMLVFTMREDNLRIISLRKANIREQKYYDQTL